MDKERKIELLNELFDSEITTKDNDVFNCDYACYEECTADGYEIYVFTCKSNNAGSVSVNEEVYYYNHDLGSVVVGCYENRNNVIHVDEFLYDHLDLDEELLNLFDEYLDELLENHDGITEEEINELKEEYGIEDEETTEA